MRFEVIELRQKGVRLKKDEIAKASRLVGDLIIEPVDWTTETPTQMYAALMDHGWSVSRRMMAPLFEPVIARMGKNWFLLRGVQIDGEKEGEERVPTTYAQEWLCRFAAPEPERKKEEVIPRAARPH